LAGLKFIDKNLSEKIYQKKYIGKNLPEKIYRKKFIGKKIKVPLK